MCSLWSLFLFCEWEKQLYKTSPEDIATKNKYHSWVILTRTGCVHWIKEQDKKKVKSIKCAYFSSFWLTSDQVESSTDRVQNVNDFNAVLYKSDKVI